jgi:hypothetical protein
MQESHPLHDNEAEKTRLLQVGATISALHDEQKGPAPAGTQVQGLLPVYANHLNGLICGRYNWQGRG